MTVEIQICNKYSKYTYYIVFLGMLQGFLGWMMKLHYFYQTQNVKFIKFIVKQYYANFPSKRYLRVNKCKIGIKLISG